MRGWGRALIERVGLFEGGGGGGVGGGQESGGGAAEGGGGGEGGLNREFTVFYVGNSKLSSD